MRKATALVLSFLFLAVFTSCTRDSGAKAGAAAGEDLFKLLPRSTTMAVVLNVKRLLEIDPVVKALQGAKAKKGYDEFVQLSGIDPKKDIDYVGFGAPASEDANRAFMPTRETVMSGSSVVVSLKYDKSRLQGLVKDKYPEAKEDDYSGVTVYSNFGGERFREWARAAFLDASHIVLGSENGVKAVIDVYQKKAEPLEKNLDWHALLGRVDKSGFAWCTASYSADLLKKGAELNPRFKFVEGFKGLIWTFKDKKSGFSSEFWTFGGTKEANAGTAMGLNGLRALGTMRAAQEPVLMELLNAIDITSGEDYMHLTLSASYETIGQLWRLLTSKDREITTPDENGAAQGNPPAPRSGQDQKAEKSADAVYHERILAQAEDMHKALLSGDLDKFIAYMPSKLITMAGGTDALKRAIEPGLADLPNQVQKISYGTLSAVVAEADGLAAYVPIEMVFLIKGTKIISVSYYVASSEDKGVTWKFMASQGQPQQDQLVKQLYPKLTSQIPLPKCGNMLADK